MFIKNSHILSLLTLLLCILGCTGLSKSEKDYLNSLNKRYEGIYVFKSAHFVYLDCIGQGETINKDTLNEIFRNVIANRPPLSWSYLKVYDSEKKFLYQLIYDNQSEEIVTNYNEEYDY